MPTPGAKEAAPLHSATLSHISKRTAPSQSPVEAPSPVASSPVPAQDMRDSGVIPEPQHHPMQEFAEDPRVQDMTASCNCCLMRVSGRQALGHLYFGNLKCANCLFVINQCRDFREQYPTRIECKRTQMHHVMTEWEKPVADYLFYCARRNFAISKFCGKDMSGATISEIKDTVANYLRALTPLRNFEPWRRVFQNPQIKNLINIPTKGEQASVAGNRGKDNPIRSKSALSTSASSTTEPRESEVQEDRGKSASQSSTEEGMEQTSTQMKRKAPHQQRVPPTTSAARTTQWSKLGSLNMQNSRRTIANQTIQPRSKAAASQATQKSALQRRKAEKETPKQNCTPLTKLQAQTEQKSSLKRKVGRQKLSSTPLPEKIAKTTQKSGPQKRKIEPEKAGQSKTQLSKITAQTTQKCSLQKRKIEPGKAGQSKTQQPKITAKMAHKSSLQKRKIEPGKAGQSKTQQTKITAQTAQKSSPQKRKIEPGKAGQSKTQQTKITAQAAHKSNPQKSKTEAEKSEQNSTTQKTQQSTPEKTNTQESRAEEAGGKHSTTLSSNITEKKAPSPSQAKRRKKLKKRKSKIQHLEFVPGNVISSGHFLVVQYPGELCPEECPSCYHPFDSKLCTVNFATFVVDFICPACHLSVYIVPKNYYRKPGEESSAHVRDDMPPVKKIRVDT